MLKVKEKVYAVVDLETTAPVNKGGKIIQIGIVLVQKDKIISTYETDVNPKEIISNTIVQLTGISHRQLFNAPSFKDIAEKISKLLFNTVFVAHNIHFDYHFLNAQLKEAGFPELDNQKLDTVELAQIFFPTASSFRLSKLTKELNIKHNHPHQAGSDAYATAELLLKIKKKITQIPNKILEKIVALSPALNVDNDLFIKELLLKRKEKIACSAEQMLVNELVLQKQKVETY
ncbi:MAG: 3'-5' exoribonuclease, partial [Lactobacillales bacterium]|nr:3'-5' exoribonuclease [Lactobacillales bacterium]